MKYTFLVFSGIIMLFGCNKNNDITPLSSSQVSNSQGSGSGSGGGDNNSTGFILSVLSGTVSRLISTHTDSILVSFTQPATVKLLSQTKTTVLKVFPLTATFPKPVLQSPGDGAGINFRIQVKFDWNDNINAYYSHFQISIDKAFTNLITNILLDQSVWGQSYFNGTGTRY